MRFRRATSNEAGGNADAAAADGQTAMEAGERLLTSVNVPSMSVVVQMGEFGVSVDECGVGDTVGQRVAGWVEARGAL